MYSLQIADKMRKIILAALLFIFVYNLLFFQTDLGIGTGLLFLFLNIFAYVCKDNNAKNVSLGIIASSLSTVFGFLIGGRANELLQNIDFVLAGLINLIALYFYKSENYFSFDIPDFLLTPVKVIIGGLKSISNIFAARGDNEVKKDDGMSTSIIRGFAIAIPVSVLLLLLLVKADPIFNKLVENFLQNIWQRLIVSMILFFGLLSIGLAKISEVMKKNEVGEEKDIEHKIYELLIISGSAVILFGIFILIQFRYFFAGNIGERELQELGINSLTYSEYVRKGFFELLAASAVASLIVLYITKFIHRLYSSHKLVTQAVSGILVAEIGLLLLSALQRLNLYQEAHGLTRARVFGFIFLVWLFFMLVIFLIRIFQELKKEWLFKLVFSSTLIIVLLLSIVNIDGLIATKYKPTVNDEIDYYYLMNLSSDAYESWEPAVLDAKRVIDNLEKIEGGYNTEHYRQLYFARSALLELKNKLDFLEKKYEKIRSWQAWNLGEVEAYDFIKNNQKIVIDVQKLIERSDIINSKISENIKSSTTLDRVVQPPLIFF